MQTLSMLLISSKQGEMGRGKREGNNFLLLPLLLFFFLVCETAFKGYCLPTSCKKHTGTGSSSPKRAHCSGVVRSSFLPLQAHFHYLSL